MRKTLPLIKNIDLKRFFSFKRGLSYLLGIAIAICLEGNANAQYIITTEAGGGVADGSAATAAPIGLAYNIALDASGNLFLVDQQHNRIRKVNASTGFISTVAGSGTAGFSGDGGLGTSADINTPFGVALDAAGNIYFSDNANNRIRKVNASDGLISTVAGNGSIGYSGDGGLATSAKLANPQGLFVDGSGNLFIADVDNACIRRVDGVSGNITTVAGNGLAGYFGDGGAATAAQLNVPKALYVNGSGDIFIADYGNNCIRKVDGATGNISTIAGDGTAAFSGDGSSASLAQLYGPTDITLDGSGNIYIADNSNQRIRKIDGATGNISTIAGTGAFGYAGDGAAATSALLNFPYGLAVNTSGDVFIADQNNLRIRKIDNVSGFISTVAGNGTQNYGGDGGQALLAALDNPVGVTEDGSGNIYLTESLSHRIRKANPGSGIINSIAGTGVSGYSGDGSAATSAQLSSPQGITTDGAGNVYIADAGNNVIRKIDAGTGNISTVAGNGTPGFSGDGGAATSAQLNNPTGVALDASGNIFIADLNNNRIRVVDATTGIITTLAGTGSASFSGDGGNAAAATMDSPNAICVDASGNVYFVDNGNLRIRMIQAGTNKISTVAGNGSFNFSGDGSPATGATFKNPNGVAVDGAGNIYISDSGNERIRKVDALTGIISTIAGTGTAGFTGDGGVATSAKVNGLNSIYANTSGQVFLVDGNNHRIRKLVCAPVTASITPGSTSICNGSSTLLTASGGTTYLWSTSATTAPITVSPTADSTFSVTVTNNCKNWDFTSQVINVNYPPTASISGVTTICKGSSTTLTASGGSNYDWNDGTTGPVATVSPTVTTTYTVTVTSSCGTASTWEVVNVTNGATVSISGNAFICNGSSTTLTASTNSSGASFVWNNSDVTASTTVSPTSTTVYTVTVSGSCGSATASQSVNVSNAPPAASISGPSTVCFGSTVILTANGAGNYLWDNGLTTASISISPTVATTYNVTVTGCGSSTASQAITIKPGTYAFINASAVGICPGGSATLTASGGQTYLWDTGDPTATVVVSPTVTTTYTVTVSGCGSATAWQQITVKAPPVASVSGNTTICNGQSTTLTASGATSYLWDNSATTPDITVSPTSTTTYSVSASDGGCAVVINTEVIVNDVPVAFISGNSNVCRGLSVSLQASGGDTYLWSTGENFAPITVSPTVTTTYYVTVTTVCGSGSTFKTVVVDNMPTISITGATNICKGNSTTLTAGGGLTYLWSTADPTASITVTPIGNVTYTVTVNDGTCETAKDVYVVVNNNAPTASINGTSNICSGNKATLQAYGLFAGSYLWNNGATTATISVFPTVTTVYRVTISNGCGFAVASKTVTVDATPVAFISGNSTICLGEVTTLTASPGASYLWSNSVTSASVTVSPTVTTAYSVKVTNGNCSALADVIVTVNYIPVASITGNATVCSGQSTTLTAGGNGTYLWDNGATTASIAVSPTTTTFYSVTVTNSCGSAVTSKPITVNNLPVVTITGSKNICFGSGTSLTATGGGTYKWNTAATTPSITVAPTYTTTYRVTVNNGLCSAVGSAVVTVTPYPGKPVITQKGNELTSSSATGNQWLLAGVPIPGAINQVYVAKESGIYNVVVSNDIGCSTLSDSLNVTVVVSSVDNKLSGTGLSMSAYPNPFNNEVTIKYQVLKHNEALRIELIDISGRLIATLINQTFANTGVQEYKVNVEDYHLGQGMYFVRLNSDTRTEMIKVSVQR